MPRFFNPDAVQAPASKYSHGASHALSGRRLVISGQIGVDSEGRVAEGLEAQFDQAFANLLAVLRADGMDIPHLLKVTAFCTQPGGVGKFRVAREKALQGHAPATTYLEVSGLATSALLVEIEGEAVMDDA
ncbi:MAG: RidA family protein [Salinarimonadaceae bacterium]|nr:MAG: RidA family protein [Salinarimonadaceae bacterium]